MASEATRPFLPELDQAHALLAAGRYAEGFRVLDRTARLPGAMRWMNLPLPRWQGEDVSGRRFLITGEQGFGDQIMLARFAKILQDRGGDIVWLCFSPLARLFTECLGFHAQSLDEGAALDDISFFLPSGELPLHFFPPLAAPPPEPYMAPPPSRVVPGAAIGVVAKGNPRHAHDAHRSLPDHLAAELLSLPGAISLDPEHTGVADFYETAQIIAGLDLVITVDTSVAHLAGAMGKPVWILLSAVWCDWRWMREREDSPWYPSARLFRQPSPGDWRGVIDRVMRAIAA